MSSKIRFDRHVQTSTIHNPMLNHQVDTQPIEVRRDPLTRHQSVFNPRLEDKVAMFLGPTDPVLLKKLAEESAPKCFLCGDKWKQMTPTYPASILPQGRIVRGEVVLFPNLFPVSQVHAVIRAGARHSLSLAEFDPELVENVLQAAVDFSQAMFAHDRSARFSTINANYLFPAGASIAHPHFQVVGGSLPCAWLEQTMSLSMQWKNENGSCYWQDLVEEEQRRGERYVGRSGSIDWVTAFSPQGAHEVLGILSSHRTLGNLVHDDVQGMAQGISHVLRGYEAMGMSTFNLSIYSGPMDQDDASVRTLVRIISRQNVYENCRSDDYFLQKLLRMELILTPPEVLAGNLRKAFG